MEIKFAPSILSADFTRLGDQVWTTRKNGAQYVHIDVMDGTFVPQLSFGDPVIRSLRPATDQVFDVHLMVEHPETYIHRMAECGADSITFHLEAAEDPAAIIRAIREEGKQVGISVKPKTDISAIRPYLSMIDLLLIMTVEPGFGGQAYIPSSTEKIAAARSMFKEAGLDTDIEVDGGINLTTIDTVLEAGANVIVAGSAVYGGDIAKNMAAFQKHFDKWKQEKGQA
jgi:ribulose-phosphate 3-epimerase